MAGPMRVTIHEQPVELIDIWSRPGVWARQRAYLFLAVSLFGYAALNVFAFWLQNARVFDFSWSGYAVTYHKTLIDLIPISVTEAPVLIPVLGFLLAVIVIVPILISQLYGFRFAVIFAATVLVFGHLPVLSIFLIACSFMASTTRHWLPFKFGVALLSLLPIAVYFYVATRSTQSTQLKDVDQSLLYAPFLLAFVSAAGMAAAVLGFARILKYRPGGILIVMITFSAIPVVLFTNFIGPDQLEYRILAQRYQPESFFGFVSVDISPQVFQETLERWKRTKIHDIEAIADIARSQFPHVALKIEKDNRHLVTDACDDFREHYPKSAFLPNLLYIRGLAQDMRVDYEVLTEDWRMAYHTDLVSPTSRSTWQELLLNYSDSVYSQPARYRLAVLHMRDGEIGSGKSLLEELLKRMPIFLSSESTFPSHLTSFKELFARPARRSIPAIDLSALTQEAYNLLELVEHNCDDPQFGNKPLSEFLTLDRHHPKWQNNLFDLAIAYAGSKLHDNLIVMSALTKTDPYMLKSDLEKYVETFRGQDAGALALFQLAELTYSFARVSVDVEQRRQNREQSIKLFQQVIKDYPDYSLAKRAAARISAIEKLSEQPGL